MCIRDRLYTKWDDLGGAAGINFLSYYGSPQTGFVYDREIRFLEWDESIEFYNDQAIQTAIHEVGHSWDSTEEIDNVLSGEGHLWNDFVAISSWTQENPNSSEFTQGFDQFESWWYHNDATFAYDYGRTNPHEDWATVFQAAYESYDAPGFSSKLAIFDQLMAAFQSA